jgi:hypothetical protein
MKREPHRVPPHGAARQPVPFDRALALLDVLLGCTELVVDHHDPIGTAREVGDDEGNERVNLARKLLGAPGFAPPCIAHRRLPFTAGDWHAAPEQVLSRQRHTLSGKPAKTSDQRNCVPRIPAA